ncbi:MULTISPECIES: ComF family protein [Shouchella]|uniref:ComF family protein n=1 Tax=Shouchella hunanensis TaxID=766894 RepID=A0ABY7W9H2_9BACI|nr:MULTISPECIES: ComF family protein [Shouchella]WDF04452.1 ComF family protein [Shouchella hunanensis]
MSSCVVCQGKFFQEISVLSLFTPKVESVCEECRKQFIHCTGCKRCRKPKRFGSFIEEECGDCVWWRQLLAVDHLDENVSLYEYNDFLKTLLSHYKYRGDVAIGHIFTFSLQEIICNRFNDYIVTAIPLSEKRMKERGFNQAEELIKRSGIHQCLTRTDRKDGRKQSKKTRYERISLMKENPFNLLEAEKTFIKGKKYLILDDIYTTGVTVRMAAKTLLEAGAERVSSLTVARAIKG